MADPRLKERYKSEIAPEMMREFKYGNLMQVPRVEKVTVNIGLGVAKENARGVESATSEIATITGQKPVVTKAKKAIANFKIRECRWAWR
jgi:large subunit ribosomal protein L5